MAGIASLPMYDRPELIGETNRFWTAIRTALGDGPETLVRGGDPWQDWRSPDLVLSQTCGLPFRAELHETVSLVGTPDYGLDGCPAGYYRSVFVAAKGDPRDRIAQFHGAKLAFNDPRSQSGWAAPMAFARDAGMDFLAGICTGSHAASARAVAEGRAEIAAIDAHSWRLMQQFDPGADALRVVGHTEPSPGLPLITAKPALARPLFAAISAAIDALAPVDRSALDLKSLVWIEPSAYLDLPLPPDPPPE